MLLLTRAVPTHADMVTGSIYLERWFMIWCVKAKHFSSIEGEAFSSYSDSDTEDQIDQNSVDKYFSNKTVYRCSFGCWKLLTPPTCLFFRVQKSEIIGNIVSMAQEKWCTLSVICINWKKITYCISPSKSKHSHG